MTFRATLTLTIANVIDEKTFRERYHGNAKAVLLDTFDGPVDLAVNAEEVLLTSVEVQ